jgi:hypothetical protein
MFKASDDRGIDEGNELHKNGHYFDIRTGVNCCVKSCTQMNKLAEE